MLQILNTERDKFYSVSAIQKLIAQNGEHIHAKTIRHALREIKAIGFNLTERKEKINVKPYHKKTYSICSISEKK